MRGSGELTGGELTGVGDATGVGFAAEPVGVRAHGGIAGKSGEKESMMGWLGGMGPALERSSGPAPPLMRLGFCFAK